MTTTSSDAPVLTALRALSSDDLLGFLAKPRWFAAS